MADDTVRVSDLATIEPSNDDLILLSHQGLTRNATVEDIRAIADDFNGGTEKSLSAEKGKVLYDKIGDTSELQTYYKDDLVGSVNENVQQIYDTNKQFKPDIYDGCIVNFIDDDAKLTTQNVFKPIADAKGIKFCSAIVESWVGTSDYMTINQIKSLQDEGHDILNHTYSHQNNWPNFTEQQIIDEINNNKDYMIANGLKGYDIIVYPGTVPNIDLNKNATRKAARYGISNIYNATSDVLDNYYMPRIDSDFQTLDGLKAILDVAIANKQWLIILSHSWRPNGGINDTAVFSTEKISQFIDYIQSKNVPIMTFTEAEKYKGNIASIGTYNNNNSIYFSKDGKNNLTGNVLFVDDNTKYSFNNPATDFKADCLTYIPIQVLNDTLTNSGGIYKVFRSSVKYYSYSEFSPYNSNKIFRRQWNEINNANAWTTFEEITTGNLKVNPNADNSFLMDTPITSYDVDKETIVTIRTTYDTFLGIGGDMRVFRSSQSNFSYATFTPWNSRSIYMRKWRENSYWGAGISTSNASWSDWRKIGTQAGTTANRPTYVDIGYNYFDTTLNKPIWYNGTNWVDSTGTTV
jgi:peptidoglycan/xylan/chitin deacetylase (PgdA/CDA1 family)